MAQGRELKGEPERLIAQALKVDPKNVKALALAGTVEFQKHNFKAAIAHWRSILDVVPPESEMAQSVRESIADAEKLAGGKLPASPAGEGETGRVSGTVRLSPALAGKVAPDDTVFIFARAAEGPRMPLAAMRKQVRDLPAAFQLDDSMAMTPAARISNHRQIVVGARVSKSGSPAPQPGDMEGLSAPAQVGGAGITVVIDTVIR
jgi:cytochrome c-type biogenesis protein CcmH